MSHTTSKEQRIVTLTPPILSKQTVLTKLSATRPVREGAFNISIERKSKSLVHCYGHGGSGWTTLWGSVNKAIALFEADLKVDKDLPIRIIGSGCMGLTSAIELVRRGYKVAGITTKERYDLPSWVAAGYFAIVSVKTSPEEEENLNQIGVETFATYQSIHQGKHPYITSEGVRYIPVYCSRGTESGLENLEARGLIPPHENVTLDFGDIQHPDFVKYMTYFIDTTKLMRQLIDEVNRLKIPIEMKEVHSFDQLSEKVIFNCSGLGSKELNQDQKMSGIRGHVIFLDKQAGDPHMDYMIYTKVMQEGKEEYIYMFPKSVSVTSSHPEGLSGRGVLGGTFLSCDHLRTKQLQTLDELQFQKLLDRCSLFFHGKKFPRS